MRCDPLVLFNRHHPVLLDPGTDIHALRKAHSSVVTLCTPLARHTSRGAEVIPKDLVLVPRRAADLDGPAHPAASFFVLHAEKHEAARRYPRAELIILLATGSATLWAESQPTLRWLVDSLWCRLELMASATPDPHRNAVPEVLGGQTLSTLCADHRDNMLIVTNSFWALRPNPIIELTITHNSLCDLMAESPECRAHVGADLGKGHCIRHKNQYNTRLVAPPFGKRVPLKLGFEITFAPLEMLHSLIVLLPLVLESETELLVVAVELEVFHPWLAPGPVKDLPREGLLEGCPREFFADVDPAMRTPTSMILNIAWTGRPAVAEGTLPSKMDLISEILP